MPTHVLGFRQSLLKDGPNVCNVVNGESIFQDSCENREASFKTVCMPSATLDAQRALAHDRKGTTRG